YSIGSLSIGTHTLRIKTDSTAAIAESDESDNEYIKTISVTSAQPDLITQNLAVAPASIVAGSQINVSFTIRNNGGATANASTADIRLARSGDSVTTSDLLVTSIGVPTLAPNGTFPVTVNVTIPSGRAAGQNYVWVIL